VPPTLSAADCLPAVPYWVGARHRQPQSSVPRPAADSRPVLFQPGHAELREAHRWQLQGEVLQARLPNTRATPALAHAVVIIGNVDHDVINGRSGPEVMAWAIASQIAASPSDAPRLLALTDPGWAVAFALLFSALALALFLLLARALQPLYQWLIAVTLGSAILTLGLFAGFVLGLRYLLFALLPQVSYVVVAVLITVGLCWHAARAALRERALTTDVSDPADSVEPSWEVFISYSHSPFENLEWVERELFQPLAQALGEERVFFDRRSIRIGTAWYFELARAIECIRCVVAVYSSDYFRKNFCTFELGKAVVRDIALRGKDFCVLPLMRGQVPVPPAFSHLQFVGATTSQEMVAMVLDRLGLPGQETDPPTSAT
jgi:hypothetical protein